MAHPRTLTAIAASALLVAGCGAGDATPRATPQVGTSAAVTSGAAPAPASTPATAPTVPAASGPATPGTTPAATRAPATAGGRRTGPFVYAFPVRASNVDFQRTHAKYPATDLFADCGEPVVAVVDGVILEVSRTDDYVKGRPDGPLNGGLSVSLLGDDGVRYYGSHLSAVQPGIDAGVRVKVGRQLGLLGRTGNANNVCHLHFGISPPCARTGDWKVRRGVVWPADYLTSWRRKGARSPVAAVAAWQRTHNCRA